MQPAAKAKKRQADDRADTPAKPKRPLSSYNLYYRFKRQQIQEAFANGMPNTKDSVRSLMSVPPGLEQHKDAGADSSVSPDAMQTLRRDYIRKDLELHLSPRDGDHRSHRKGRFLDGAMSFAEFAKLIAEYWGCIDVFSRSVFEQLAQEGREVHAARVKEYKDHLEKPSNILKKYLPMPVSKEEETEAAAMAVAGTMIELAKTNLALSPIEPKKKTSAKNSAAVQADLIDYLAKKNKPAKQTASEPQEVPVANREIMQPIINQGFVRSVSHSEDTASSASASPNPVGEIGATGGLTNDMLMSRIQALEQSLEAERYHARVREIEVELAETRAREGELLSMLSNLTRPTTFSAGCNPSAPHNNLVMQSGYGPRTGFVRPSLSGAGQATMSPRFMEHQYSYPPATAMHYPAEHEIVLPNKKQRRH